MSLYLSEKLAEEVKSLNTRKMFKDSLLSAIIQTLVAIEDIQNEVLVPSLMSESRFEKSGDEPNSEELSATELLNAAKLIKALILDRHVPTLDSFLDINNNNTSMATTSNGLTAGANGLLTNGYRYRKETDHKNETNKSKTLVITIVGQITALKKSLTTFRELLNELNDRYNETIEKLPTLHRH